MAISSPDPKVGREIDTLAHRRDHGRQAGGNKSMAPTRAAANNIHYVSAEHTPVPPCYSGWRGISVPTRSHLTGRASACASVIWLSPLRGIMVCAFGCKGWVAPLRGLVLVGWIRIAVDAMRLRQFESDCPLAFPPTRASLWNEPAASSKPAKDAPVIVMGSDGPKRPPARQPAHSQCSSSSHCLGFFFLGLDPLPACRDALILLGQFWSRPMCMWYDCVVCRVGTRSGRH